MKPVVIIDDAVNLLNELARLDNQCVRMLIENRIPCNDAVADHRYIQTYVNEHGHSLGLLGFLNGLFEIPGIQWGTICMRIDRATDQVEFFKRENV